MTKTERQFVKVEKGEKVEIIAIEPFQHNSPEYKCCCNAIHFKMGAAIIGILTIIAALITITLSAIWNYWWPIIPAIIFLGLAILILYAHKSEKQNFYLPYSIVTGILILTAFLFVILSIVLIIFIPSWSQDFVQNVRSRQFDDEQQKHDVKPENRTNECAIHFKMGAAIIGILTIIAALITITLSAIWNYWWPIIPAIIFLGLAILILYAHKSEKQNFYLPYSIVTGILILTAFLFVILSIVLIIFIPSWSQDFVQNVRSRQFDDEQQKHDATRVFYTWLIITLLIFILIGAWFVWVVYKAFMYMRDMHLARHPYKFLYTNGIKDGLEHTQNSGMSGRQHHATNGNVEKY